MASQDRMVLMVRRGLLEPREILAVRVNPVLMAYLALPE